MTKAKKNRLPPLLPAASKAAISREDWWPLLGFVAVIWVCTFLVYQPAMKGGFIWDDDAHVTRPELQSLDGLRRIWFELGATQQYYPLLHSAFWVEHKLWGDNAYGYHLANVFLHAMAASLVLVVLRKLRIPGALLAALIFALHPVQVESVAWITEQKNTLSAIFYLAAMWAYLEFDESRRTRFYWLALALFVIGLMTKTVTATLPAALLVIFWWKRGRIDWRRDVLPLVPFFVLGGIAGLFTAWVERKLIGAEGAEFAMPWLDRGLLAGRTPWFYFSTLVWPVNLSFVYPRWSISGGVWWQWLFPLATILTLTALWAVRRRWRAPLAGVLLFVGTLFPVLGFLNVYPFRYSYVADHFQYLACLGIIVLVAAAIAGGLAHRRASIRVWSFVGSGVLIGVLSIITWRQCHLYADLKVLYQTTIARNPQCWMAYNNLGNVLVAEGNSAGALECYRRAIELKPNYAEACTNYGSVLYASGQHEEAVDFYNRALEVDANYALAHYNLGIAAVDAGRPQDAVGHYRKAAELNPRSAATYNNLGNALTKAGDVPAAIAAYEQALDLNPQYAKALTNLARTLTTAGRYSEAANRFQQALAMDPLDLDACRGLVQVYVALNRPDDVSTAVQQAIRAARARKEFALANEMEAWLNDFVAQQNAD